MITSCRECNRGKQNSEIIPKKVNYFEESKKITTDMNQLLSYAEWLTNEMFATANKIKEKHIENFQLFYDYLDNHDGNFSENDLGFKKPCESMDEFREKYLLTIKNKMLDYISEVKALDGPNEILDYSFRHKSKEIESTKEDK